LERSKQSVKSVFAGLAYAPQCTLSAARESLC
jgi:hypothetical protein